MTTSEANKLLDEFSGTRVLVVGDVMLDRYLRGRSERRSPEADVPVLDHESTSTKLGGAGNVALNFKSLGCQTHIIAITGQDEGRNELEGLFNDAGISQDLIGIPGRPTTIKTRIIADKEHLLRVDFESTEEITSDYEKKVISAIRNYVNSNQPEMIVLQDYNKGLLTEYVITNIIDIGHDKGIHISVDPKKENFWLYKRIDLFKPNLRETEEAIDKSLTNQSEWQSGAKTLKSKLSVDTVALTLGGDGILIMNNEGSIHRPAIAVDVVDVCGAGDAVLAILSLMHYKSKPLDRTAEISNLVGGNICRFSGVQYITKEMLLSDPILQ
ncbi:MAG: bifunctional ADP-heptose synthase [Saprospiraceae bacterium]|nr:bifunctional ADP-heptose synthase [Saprospiraceae bacterium]